mgnify:FL=1
MLLGSCRIIAPHNYNGSFQNIEKKSIDTNLNLDSMKLIKSQYNYDAEDQKYEQNNGEIHTVPDQSLTIREILHQYTSGIMPDFNGNGDYEYGIDDYDQIGSALSKPSLVEGVDPLTDRQIVQMELERIKSKNNRDSGKQPAAAGSSTSPGSSVETPQESENDTDVDK